MLHRWVCMIYNCYLTAMQIVLVSSVTSSVWLKKRYLLKVWIFSTYLFSLSPFWIFPYPHLLAKDDHKSQSFGALNAPSYSTKRHICYYSCHLSTFLQYFSCNSQGTQNVFQVSVNEATSLLCSPFWLQMHSQITPPREEWRRREGAGAWLCGRRVAGPRQALTGWSRAAPDITCHNGLTDTTSSETNLYDFLYVVMQG